MFLNLMVQVTLVEGRASRLVGSVPRDKYS
jgi:hypothetical protein